jgi:exosortase
MSCSAAAPSAAHPRSKQLPWRLVGVLAAAAAALTPLLWTHAQQLWRRPHYQFFPLLLVGALVLACSRVGRLGPLQPGARRMSIGLAALAWCITGVAVALHASTLGAVGALVLAAAVAVTAGGTTLLRAVLPALFLAALALPLPSDLDRRLLLYLQGLTTRWSSGVLDLLGVFHLMSGHVVEVGGQRLLVEEACSGVNSLFVILAGTLFWALWARRSVWHSGLLVASSVLWVLLCNVARVSAITYASSQWDWPVADGWLHEALGLTAFVLACALTWSSDALLQLVLPRSAGAGGAPAEASRWPDVRGTWLQSPSAAAAFLVLLLPQLATLWDAPLETAAGVPADTLASLTSEALPASWGRWSRHGFAVEKRNPGSNFGEQSLVWKYRLGNSEAGLSLDFPFPDWHQLTHCYTSQGWQVETESLQQQGEVGFVVVELAKPAYRCGYLLFAEFDARGAPLEPAHSGTGLTWRRYRHSLQRWAGLLRGEQRRPEPTAPIYQVQLFVESYTPLTAEERAAAREFFLSSAAALHQRCFAAPLDTTAVTR